MKNKLFLLAIIATFSFATVFSSCAGNSSTDNSSSNDDRSNNSVVEEKDPIEYNDEVLFFYTELDEQIAQFENYLWADDVTVEEMQQEYDKTMTIYEDNYDVLNAIEPLKNDPGFHATVVEFYDGVKNALDNEYKQIMDMYNADEWEDEFMDQIFDLDDAAIDRLIELENKVTDIQQDFANAYGITLI